MKTNTLSEIQDFIKELSAMRSMLRSLPLEIVETHIYDAGSYISLLRTSEGIDPSTKNELIEKLTSYKMAFEIDIERRSS